MGFLKGLRTGYYSGDPLKLLDDMQCLKPTFFCCVPRILNRVYSKIVESISTKSALVQWLFSKAVESKKFNYENYG